jgi:hypothetical protein
MRLPCLLGALATLAILSIPVDAATRDDFLYGQAEDGSNLPFRYFVPPGYDSAQAYPLILFLHGAGERGSDNEAQLNNNANGAMKLIGDSQLALQPIFMIAPQCPTDGWWSGATLTSAIGLVDQVAADALRSRGTDVGQRQHQCRGVGEHAADLVLPCEQRSHGRRRGFRHPRRGAAQCRRQHDLHTL